MELVGIGEFARLARLSPKALRLYDQSGLLPPAQVDAANGYRWYAVEQLEAARLIAVLRQLGMPLAQIAPLLPLDDDARAAQITAWWTAVEIEHSGRRTLAAFLVDRVSGRKIAMSNENEVAVRDLPARSMLTMMRHVRADELLAVGKEFINKLRGTSTRVGPGAVGAPFVVYYAEVNQDSDGPIEWCWPVRDDQVEELVARFPELTLRVDPAHEEAYIFQGPAAQVGEAQATVAIERMIAWVTAQRRQPSGGVRQVFLSNPANGETGPDCDFAVALR